MEYIELLRKKTITAEDAISLLPDDSYIYTYGASGEPKTFLSHLHLVKDAGKRVTTVGFLNTFPFDYYADEAYADVIRNESLFFNRFCTGLQKSGRMSFIPNHLRNSGSDRTYYHGELDHKAPIVFVIPVTPMDGHGYFSTSTVAMSQRDLLDRADLVILEINENLPRTFGDTYIHISEADHVFQGDNEVFYLPNKPVDEVDQMIGGYIAELIEDGSTIQLGIGGIPNAVAIALKGKKDLGVHTEMLNDGLVQLCREGVVTNRRKTLYKDRMVTTFTFGNRETYEFLHDNVGVLHLRVEETNAPEVIARNYKMVSVNTTLQVDLMGQCASEAIGTMQISGTGGQSETAVGAKQAQGGKSIMALHSTAMVKTADGERERRSTIVGVHPAGTVISMLRADTDFVVTEYGVAALRGASLEGRARSLIQIAHPDYREELRAEARRYHLL